MRLTRGSWQLSDGQKAMIFRLKPLNNTSSSHSGLDPESSKHLIKLDTGLRRYDDIAGWARLCKPLRLTIHSCLISW